VIQYGAPNSPLKGPWICDTGTPTDFRPPHYWSVCCIHISPHCTLITMLTWAWRIKLHPKNWHCMCHVCGRNAITNSGTTCMIQRRQLPSHRHAWPGASQKRQQNTRGTSGGVAAHIPTLWKRNSNDG